MSEIAPAAGAAATLIGGGTPLGWFQAASPLFSAALSGPPPATSSASLFNSSTFNSSGYTVATGGSKANGSSSFPWYVYALAGLAIIVWYKKK